MNRRNPMSLVSLAAALVATAAPALGQTWTEGQLEVWAVIESQWQAAMAKDTTWPDRFLHDNFVGWDRANPAPRDKASTRKWNRYAMENATVLVEELHPLRIVIHGNTAVAHYLYSVAAEDRKGERETTHGRFTDVLVKDRGTWRFLAWHGGDDPKADS